jgi:hypothetical protein
MALQTMVLDPNAASYTDDQIVAKVNAATAAITRANAVSAAARPIGTGEVASANIATGAVTSTLLASGVAKTNLDSMTDTARGYIKTSPTTGQFRVVAIQRDSAGKTAVVYDDVAV